MSPDTRTALVALSIAASGIAGGSAMQGCFTAGDTMVGFALLGLLAAQWTTVPKGLLWEGAYCLALSLAGILVVGVLSDILHFRDIDAACTSTGRDVTYIILWLDLTLVAVLLRWLTRKIVSS